MNLKAVGGYFELELPDFGGFFHEDGILLNSGRNALEYIIRSLAGIQHIWVPYYSCSVVLEPIEKLRIPYSFYSIDENLEIKETIYLQSGDYLLYTNYFGIKDWYACHLAGHFESRLIIDNAQAWFATPVEGVGTFYSPRKFVGIPDGGVAYCSGCIDEGTLEMDYSFERCGHLLKRLDIAPSEGYADFRSNSAKLIGQPIRRMSKLTRRMLHSIDFERIKKVRRQNFEYLHQHLKGTNLFTIPSAESFTCPMVYPYLTDDSSLKQKLVENQVFVATYWSNVKERVDKGMLEYELVDKLIPLPIDQRYSADDMERIVSIIKG